MTQAAQAKSNRMSGSLDVHLNDWVDERTAIDHPPHLCHAHFFVVDVVDGRSQLDFAGQALELATAHIRITESFIIALRGLQQHGRKLLLHVVVGLTGKGSVPGLRPNQSTVRVHEGGEVHAWLLQTTHTRPGGEDGAGLGMLPPGVGASGLLPEVDGLVATRDEEIQVNDRPMLQAQDNILFSATEGSKRVADLLSCDVDTLLAELLSPHDEELAHKVQV
mmetsp:Transcript_10414/g.25084  ORF Transcript_10414/g.25084 Transcript_10414/m.25084 type:complete len:221 (-) Transcript_10414:575-1237(-)